MQKTLLFVVFILVANLPAQLPQSFVKNAWLQYDGSANDVAIGLDGTIFVTYYDRLIAYSYNGVSFTPLASINTGGEGMDIAIGSDGTIFLANMWDGIRAYTYHDESFENKGHIYNNGDAHGITIGSDGTIFIANLSDGLRAYTYNGSSFTNTAHFNNNYDSHDVAVGPDGTVFLANYWDGLRAFTYNGSSFSNTAHIKTSSPNESSAFSVEVDSNGTIFLGSIDDGLRAYTYNGSSFTNTAHIDNGGEALGIALDSYGTIYLANGFDGLRAYVYDGTSFYNTAYIKDEGDSRNVTISSDGTIFVANSWEGVFSYSYSGYNGIPFFFISPNFCFRDNIYTAAIFGVNTHFTDNAGVANVWISKNENTISADNFVAHSNTSLDVELTIPAEAPIGPWDINIETSVDSIIKMENAIDVGLNGNYALQFDGVNDYIKMLHSESLDFTTEMTIEAWIRPESWIYNPRIFQKGDDDRLRLLAESYSDQFSEYLKFSINGKDLEAMLPPLYTWTHVAGVYDGKYSKIFLNGSCLDSLFINESIEQTLDPLFIGTRDEDTWEGDFFDGQIDEVRLWNRALNQREIRANMYNHLSGSENGLVGYWPFNEGSGLVVNDFTAYDNHGGLFGTTWVSSGAPVGKVFLFCKPVYGYLNHNFFTTIQGANTHFASGIQGVWLSKDDLKISANRVNHRNNTLIDVRIYIPPGVPTGKWAINVETTLDSIITIPFGVELLPPPSVTPQSVNSSAWLRSVYALNDQVCWVVGNDGIVHKTVDGGITWKSQNSNTSNVLYSTFFSNENTGWAVGQYGTIINTNNGGSDWTAQESGTSNNLQSVYFIDGETGWTVGRSGTILKTTNGGTTWNPQTSNQTSWLYSVYFADINNGWVVGSNGTIINTTDGGESWVSQSSGTSNYLSSVYFYDSTIGWAVGSNGSILKTIDSGSNWIHLNTETTEWFKSVYFRDSQMGWTVGTNGIMLMTEDGGDHWSARTTWTKTDLSSINFADDISGWTVGETGRILSLKMNNLATKIENQFKSTLPPQSYELFQNYPNPFNPVTVISYQIPVTSYVNLSIYDLIGRKVKTLVSEKQEPGFHQVEWNASGVASGVYFYQLNAGEFVNIRKMVLIR